MTHSALEYIKDFKSRIEKVSRSIESFKNNLHDVYLRIGNVLHNSIDIALKSTIEEIHSILLLLDNDDSTQAEVGMTMGIYQILRKNFDEISVLTNPMRQKRDRGDESFSKSLRYLSEINQMLTSVDIVQDFANDMEVLSFNSIILASKSGVKGIGFKSISGYINELSRETGYKFQELKKVSRKVLDNYDHYNYLIINTRNLRIETSNKLKHKADVFFDTNLKNTKRSIDSIKKVEKHLKSTKDGIFNIIIELQNEDIINQIISNLIHQIGIINETLSGYDFTEKENLDADIFIFCCEVDKFFIDKFEKIRNNLEKLFSILENNVDDFEDTVNDVEQSIDDILCIAEIKRKDCAENKETGFLDNSTEILEELQKLIKQIINFQNQINDSGKNFLVSLNTVDKIYSNLEDIIERMKSVNVLVKIELVRENIESYSTNNTGNVMESMVSKISDYLGELIDKFRDTKDKLSELMTNIDTSVHKQKERFIIVNTQVQDFLNDYLERISDIKNSILIEINNLKDIIYNIKTELKELKRDMGKLKDLIKNQSGEINIFKEDLDGLKKFLKHNYDINEPNIELIKDKKLLETLIEVENRQNKASLDKYLEDDFDYESDGDDNVFIF